jgi:hypothetical protein
MQVLVVKTSQRWSLRHPFMDDTILTDALAAEGVHVHPVPIPVFDGGLDDAAVALRLLPFDAYGDVLLGLGHLAALILHKRLLVVVDNDVIPDLAGEHVPHRRRSTLVEGLRAAEHVFSLSPSATRELNVIARVRAENVESPEQLTAAVGRLKP